MLSYNDILARANERYNVVKGRPDDGYGPGIRSDQVKVAIEAIVEAVNAEIARWQEEVETARFEGRPVRTGWAGEVVDRAFDGLCSA